MASKTGIEWTDATWNPARGCSRVSEGCRHCYAEGIAARFSGELPTDEPGITVKQPFHTFADANRSGSKWTGKVALVEKHLIDPLRWRKARMIFVNSMSDLWHEGLRADDQAEVYAVMAAAHWHTFQVLTKRPQNRADAFRDSLFAREVEARAGKYFIPCGLPNFKWPLPNVWEGVSVENQATADERIPLLLQTPAAVRFISYEPALEAVDFAPWLPTRPYHFSDCSCLDCCDNRRKFSNDGKNRFLDWVICGGESGQGARPFDIKWARNAARQCKAAGVPCFVKQLGSNARTNAILGYDDAMKRLSLKERKGGDWNEWPADLRVRQFPEAHHA